MIIWIEFELVNMVRDCDQNLIIDGLKKFRASIISA